MLWGSPGRLQEPPASSLSRGRWTTDAPGISEHPGSSPSLVTGVTSTAACEAALHYAQFIAEDSKTLSVHHLSVTRLICHRARISICSAGWAGPGSKPPCILSTELQTASSHGPQESSDQPRQSRAELAFYFGLSSRRSLPRGRPPDRGAKSNPVHRTLATLACAQSPRKNSYPLRPVSLKYVSCCPLD